MPPPLCCPALDSPHLKFPTRATSDEYSFQGESESRPRHFDGPRGLSIGFVARHPTREGIHHEKLSSRV